MGYRGDNSQRGETMTLERLKQYLPELAEQREAIKELHNLQGVGVETVVSGSSNEYPYLPRRIVMRGAPENQVNRAKRLRRKIRLAARHAAEVENWVDALDDAQLRMVVRYKFMQRPRVTWQQTADYIGGGNTADGLRKQVGRACQRK